MLILTRKENERVCLGDEITLTIVRLVGDKVRIGVEAPAHIKVLRKELEIDLSNTSIPIVLQFEQPKKAA